MSITTHTDQDKRLHVVFDDERTEPVERYTIWLVNGSRDVLAQPFESPKAVWQRVLNTLAAMRVAITLSSGHLYFATVFADVQPTEQHMQGIRRSERSIAVRRGLIERGLCGLAELEHVAGGVGDDH